MDNAYLELLTELAQILTDKLREEMPDVPPVKLGLIAIEVTEDLMSKWRGGNIYFPKDDKREILERDMAIVREFDGTNWLEISRKYNICQSRIYQILANYKRQGVQKVFDLFPPDEEEPNGKAG